MAKTTIQPGHDVVTTTFIDLVAVALFAILAGMSDDMGKVMLILMWGFFLGWCLLHTSQLGTMVKSL
jgi:hypothetical protein